MMPSNAQLVNGGPSNDQAPETVPYAHGAAGHQGISTSTDGSMLIKPCTQAEIDFYESARLHPEFQAHMPVYMGSLTLGDQKIQQQASALQSQQADDASMATAEKVQSGSGSGSGNGGANELKPLERGHRRGTSMGHIVSEPRIGRSATKEWTPSGGAKLSSNLSIVLSNATAGFTKPNVIDLKLGARLWDDAAPLNKRAKLDEVARSSTSGSLGFRVAGMKVFVGDDVSESQVQREVNTEVHDGYKTYDKFYGRNNVDDRTIGDAFDAFLYSLNLPSTAEKKEQSREEVARRKALLKRKLLLERLHRETSSIEYVLENEESRMYSASVLMVYEGDPDALESVIKYQEEDGKVVDAQAVETEAVVGDDEEDGDADEVMDDDEEELKQKVHEVVMIDFAHAHWTPGQGPDENMLQGIRSIRKVLEDMLASVQKQLDS